MTPEEVLALMSVADEYMPVVRQGISVLGQVGGELRPLIENFQEFSIQMKIRAFNKFIEAGFSREEAMLLVIDSTAALQQSIQRMGNNSTVKKGGK